MYFQANAKNYTDLQPPTSKRVGCTCYPIKFHVLYRQKIHCRLKKFAN